MAHQSDIPLSGFSLNIVKRCGLALSGLFDSKFGCVATFEGVDFESSGKQKRQTVAPQMRYSVTLPAGVRVSVWKADLTTIAVDAVVNAANSSLQHGAGLAYALCEAGGPQIQMESDSHTRKHGPLQTGEAVVTNAGSLPCKKIIHAVGPQLSYNPSSSEFLHARALLENAIRNILYRVEENHMHTVAIPAISSGLFNFPLRECANTIVLTVMKYYQFSSQRHLPKEILLANHDEPTVSEMERACREILAPKQSNQPMSYSQAAGSKTRRGAETPDFSVQVGNVLLTLKKAKIEDQRTDVIVNTASQALDLNVGKISSALLNKAGREMQTEIRKATPASHLISTGGYRLHCKEVYHTFCMGQDKTGASQILFQSVSECLWMAATKKHKSIAFPAIGTGALGFTKEESASIMLNAVVNFAQNLLGKMEVYFVIFPADSDIFQVFKEKMKYLQKGAYPSSFPQGAYPSTFTQGAYPSTFTQGAYPSSFPQGAYPSTFTQGAYPSSFPQGAYPSSFPQGAYPSSFPQGAYPSSFPQGAYPSSFPQGASPSSFTQAYDNKEDRAPSPQISLRGPSEESIREAKKWLTDHFASSSTIHICNNFIQHLSEKDYQQLSRLTKKGVKFEEFLTNGHACLTVDARSLEDIIVAALQVEAMLCTVQGDFVAQEENEMFLFLAHNVPRDRERKTKTVEKSQEFNDRVSALSHDDLRILKVDRVENPSLEQLFDLKKKQLQCSSSEKMFQRIPAQFCEMVSRIGFHAECAPPEDPKYGEGIYFARTVKKAMEVWKSQKEEYLYFVEAEVLTGQSTRGEPGLILPPAVGTDPLVRFDSVSGGSGIAVIFSSYQALPRYIITCEKRFHTQRL